MSKYHDRQVGGVKVDVYRVLRLFGITDPAIQHAVKKLLRCGRGYKDKSTDIKEAIASLNRYLEMEREDAAAPKAARLRIDKRGVSAWHFERRGAELEDTTGHAGANG